MNSAVVAVPAVMQATGVQSGIYEGTVRHRRFAVRPHEFHYKVFMMLADIDRVGDITKNSFLWSYNKPGLASFHERDFLAAYAGSLREKVSAAGEAAGHCLPDGKVFLLANWRYFGYMINPIACFYCYNARGELEMMVVEVTNTPWKERQVYVLPCETKTRIQHLAFDKAMHVSPFMAMDMQYVLSCNEPMDRLSLHLENHQHGKRLFDATLGLRRLPVTSANLRRVLLVYPLMTLKVFLAIHWQALKLFIKKVPVFMHPARAIKKALKEEVNP